MKLGFIGLGRMGAAMASNLVKISTISVALSERLPPRMKKRASAMSRRRYSGDLKPPPQRSSSSWHRARPNLQTPACQFSRR